MVTGRVEDLDTVLEILDDAARWVVSQGWDGWKPGSFSRQTILEQLERGEVYLGKIGGETIGTITLQWSDRMFWGEVPQDAGYIHKLAVKRAHAGREVGLQLLRWAERRALSAGKRYLRLNCLASDRGLCNYYERAGFEHVRNIIEQRGLASFYEKRL
jgi:GNAT superfamily N-acetyltransferase